MLRLMGVEPGARVPDAGCGPRVHNARVARAGCRVGAIDISQTILQEAQARIAAASLVSAVEFRQEDLIRLKGRLFPLRLFPGRDHSHRMHHLLTAGQEPEQLAERAVKDLTACGIGRH